MERMRLVRELVWTILSTGIAIRQEAAWLQAMSFRGGLLAAARFPATIRITDAFSAMRSFVHIERRWYGTMFF
jgi:hypothetical protein